MKNLKPDSNLTDSIRSQQFQPSSECKSTKLQKLKLYVSNSQDELPLLTSDMVWKQKVATLLRVYFNDKQLLIFYNYKHLESCLQTNQFSENIEILFDGFVKTQVQGKAGCASSNNSVKQTQKQLMEIENEKVKRNLGYKMKKPKQQLHVPAKNKEAPKKLDFIAFIQYWVQNENQLKIFYEPYNQMVNQLTIQYLDQLEKDILNSPQTYVVETKSKNNEPKKKVDDQKRQLNINIKQIQNNTNQCGNISQVSSNVCSAAYSRQTNKDPAQPKDSFRFYMKKFYQFYCKKCVNPTKDHEFDKLQQYYSTMSLPKFMQYCRDVKLSHINKKVTVKYFQKEFKVHQDHQNHTLSFQSFCNIVKKALQLSYSNPNDIQTKGYEHIGVLSRPNYAQVMKSIGIIVPLKKIVFRKIPQVREKSTKSHRKRSQNLSKSRILREDHKTFNKAPEAQKNGGYGHGYQSSWDSKKPQKEMFMNQKQRKQQRLLQNLSISKLNKLQPSKGIDDRLFDIIDDEYDPYLKRYNDKNQTYQQNIVPASPVVFSKNSGTKSAHKTTPGVIKRMDQRINSVVSKIR